jgi:catechol 2,3-dioxygenase-like lactoylglutathione lyase family enzyme
MKLLGLDHVGIVVPDINAAVTQAGGTLEGRAVGDRFVSDSIDLQVVLCGATTLELIEVRTPGFGMPKLTDAETPIIGHFGIEVDNLEEAKAELTRRGVVLEGETDTDDVRFIFTVPKTTFGVTVQFMDYKGRRTGPSPCCAGIGQA